MGWWETLTTRERRLSAGKQSSNLDLPRNASPRDRTHVLMRELYQVHRRICRWRMRRVPVSPLKPKEEEENASIATSSTPQQRATMRN